MVRNPIDEQIVNKVRQFAQSVNRVYPLEQTVIFGSQAKKTASELSDIDVCLVSKHFTKSSREIRHELGKISEQFDERIEVHPMLPEDFNNRYYTFAQEIKAYGVVVS